MGSGEAGAGHRLIVGDRSWEFVSERGIARAGIRYRCPCCGGEGILPFRGISQLTPSWIWDGNAEAPTLSPSILRSRTCGWHGFLTAGHLVNA